VRDHSGDIGADRRMILNQILKKEGVKIWTGFIWLSGLVRVLWQAVV
jgi:hypothetical protein